MQKKTKRALLILAFITLATLFTAVWMLDAVLGDALFYMNSTLGRICAVSYRWVCLASGLLVLFWVLAAIKVWRKIRRKETEKEADTEKTKVKNMSRELEEDN